MTKTHITSAGETFDLIALSYFYDEKMSSAIIEVNPDYCDVLIFEEGVALTIPDESSVQLPESLPPWRRDK